MVTTKDSIRVEDITFHGARSQREVEREILAKQGITDIDRPTAVPNSFTPEQLIKFYEECSVREKDRVKVYSHTIKVIREYDRLAKENRMLKARIIRISNENSRLNVDNTEGNDGDDSSTID